jgi:NAD(P)-dependent dehydrogenase (short-subunit alcohol dehydrogenase family)
MTIDFFNIEGRVILVTGASGHLGAAIVKRLYQAGAFIYLNGRVNSKLEALKSEINDRSERLQVLAFDIADTQSRDEALGIISKKSHRLDGLVNNAFLPLQGSVDQTRIEDFQKSFLVNVSATFDLTRACLDLLSKDRDSLQTSSVVNIASMYGMVSPDPSIYGNSGMNNPPFYGASKAALIQLTRYFATHIIDMGIRTNTISPGPFPPESIKSIMPDFYDNLCNKTPMKRIGRPAEVAAAVHFLLSPDSSYINGANIPVDGGWTVW